MSIGIIQPSSPLFQRISAELPHGWFVIGADGVPDELSTKWCAMLQGTLTRVEYAAPIGEFPNELITRVRGADRRHHRRQAWSRVIDLALVAGIAICGSAAIVAQWVG